jgi:hypothetical protein
MNRKRTLSMLILIGLTVLVVAAGCSESQAATLSSPASQTTHEIQPTIPPPTPIVITLVVTPTPQPPESPGPQSAPSLTRVIPSPTPSPTKESPDVSPEEDPLKAEVTVAAGNVRSGPGLGYPVIGQVSRGDILIVFGRNAPGDWLQITWGDRSGWLSSSLVKLNSAITGLEVAEAPAPPPASPTPTPQPSEVPYCDSVPIRGFGTIWGEHPSVAATLGCPSWPYREQGTDAAAQTFEHGLMLWLAADASGGGDPVYVLFDTGEYQRFPDMGPADPAAVGDIPASSYPPGDRFSKVYWEGTGVRVRQRLGFATGSQIDSPGAYQQFWNGRMFWTGALDRIFVLYDYWQWDETGENGVQIRSWTDFEDTFGN